MSEMEMFRTMEITGFEAIEALGQPPPWGAIECVGTISTLPIKKGQAVSQPPAGIAPPVEYCLSLLTNLNKSIYF